MRRILLSVVLFTIIHGNLRAQGAATFHVFAQLADGRAGDGTFYFSSLLAVNVSPQPAACTVRVYGSLSNRLLGSLTFTLPAMGSFWNVSTALAEGVISPLATGYATLTCSQSVAATVAYTNLSPAGTVLAAAEVFSSPPTTRAELIMLRGGRYRSAVAVANDTDTPADYQLTVTNLSGQQIGVAGISVPARSNTAKFVDELVPLPDGFAGAALISSSAGTPFSAVGLVYSGSVFFSQPVVTFSTYNDTILGDHPVAFYDVNPRSGAESDISGNGNTGTYYGGFPAVATMPNGDVAADFDGSTQYLSIRSPANNSLSIPVTGSLTTEAWIRPDVLQFPNNSNGYVNWMGKCAAYSPTCEWAARMYNTTNPEDRCNRLSAYVFNRAAGLGSGAFWQPLCGSVAGRQMAPRCQRVHDAGPARRLSKRFDISWLHRQLG